MPDRLTASELRCVRLAGEGLSDKQIALRLKIAHRTVNAHMLQAYRKLAVSDRRSAAEAVRRDYGELPIPIAEAEAGQFARQADAKVNAESQTGDGPLAALLMTVFRTLSPLGRPRRIGGSVLPMILVWSLMALVLLTIVLALSSALLGSANDLASRVYATAEKGMT